MPYVCPLCALQPASHSLKIVEEKGNVLYFYTCPAEATLYFDVDGIINHYNGVLSEIPSDREWIWIFDSFEFSLKHALQFNVAIELAKLISTKFSKNLKKVIIINPTIFINFTYRLLQPFLNEKLLSVIDMNTEYKTINEVLA